MLRSQLDTTTTDGSAHRMTERNMSASLAKNGKLAGGRGRRRDPGQETRMRIIESAEELFADSGYEGASLRKIMANAKVSISLINYHFGNKEGLLRAIFEHKAAPLNEQRRALIRTAVAAHNVPRIDDLLRAYFLPSFRDSLLRRHRKDHFMRLVSRIGSDNSEIAHAMMREFFDDFQYEFVEALKLALPDLPEDDIYWRLHCLLCIVTHSLNNPVRILHLSGGQCDLRDVDYAFEHLLPFLKAGLSAPTANVPSDVKRASKADTARTARVVSKKPQRAPALIES